ncbi:FAD-dependent oxidoreductase [Sphingobium sp. Sx8-8]|uniref:FAD-dependent oxidoreductase n=1 Tax=Sphingobium sp. Sx8-8 TaxID=2933617 RepID=UPI001F59B934|nr:FAD-dependent oxidoreductase [Sphingobium sp. Sx8-8]
MTYVITQSCCVDAACVPVCPVDCIHPTTDEGDFAKVEMLYIDPVACVDCGACAEACPVDAIVPDHGLTEEDRCFADFANAYYAETGRAPRRPVLMAGRPERADAPELRVAIVGTGPSACYAALDLLERRDVRAEIIMIERLPAFGGLVRYGVAPDHQRTKRAADAFQRQLARGGVRFLFNMEIGRDISVAELHAHFHAIIYAVGAPGGRNLGIAGEDLPGVLSASRFVGWYNGHPDHAGLAPDLSGRRAVIVGNGNVALDVARILLGSEADLATSDIAAPARAALAGSAIEEVVILGRRGPAQTAGTASELSALARMEDIDIIVDAPPALLDQDASGSFAERLKRSLLADMARRPLRGHRKRLVFRYFRAPLAIEGDGHTERLLLSRTDDADAAPEALDCGLVISSIGYRGAALEGLPYDEARGIYPNEGGRILPGTYATGWIKRGPSGVIGSNRRCAAETVDALIADFGAGRLPAPSGDDAAFAALAGARRSDHFGLDGWERIDRHERANATSPAQVRAKLTSIAELVAVAKG